MPTRTNTWQAETQTVKRRGTVMDPHGLLTSPELKEVMRIRPRPPRPTSIEPFIWTTPARRPRVSQQFNQAYRIAQLHTRIDSLGSGEYYYAVGVGVAPVERHEAYRAALPLHGHHQYGFGFEYRRNGYNSFGTLSGTFNVAHQPQAFTTYPDWHIRSEAGYMIGLGDFGLIRRGSRTPPSRWTGYVDDQGNLFKVRAPKPYTPSMIGHLLLAYLNPMLAAWLSWRATGCCVSCENIYRGRTGYPFIHDDCWTEDPLQTLRRPATRDCRTFCSACYTRGG